MSLSPPFILQNLKRTLRADPESFSDPKWPICPEQIFLVQTIIITFISLLALFIVKNSKNSYCGFRVMMMHIFWAQNGPFAQKKFWKIIDTILIYLLAPSIVQNLKKNSSWGSRVTRMLNFGAQNGPFPQMRIFFRKPVNVPCFFHSCLSKYQKSKSYINLSVKYWWLKNTDILLAKSHFWP